MLIQKARTHIQSKLKIEPEPKAFVLEEFRKVQCIVDEVMGK